MNDTELRKAKVLMKALHKLFYNIRPDDFEYVKGYMNGHFMDKLNGRVMRLLGGVPVLDVDVLHGWFHSDLNEELQDYFIELAIKRY